MASKKEIKYSIDKEKAIKIAKKATSGKFAITKDNGASFKAGSPGMTALVEVEDGVIYVSGGGLAGPIANTIHTEISNAIEEACEKSNSSNKGSPNNQALDIDIQLKVADALVKFKSLLDAGIITEEEFNSKKKELLGQMSANTTQVPKEPEPQPSEEKVDNNPSPQDVEEINEKNEQAIEGASEGKTINEEVKNVSLDSEEKAVDAEESEELPVKKELTPEEKAERKKKVRKLAIISSLCLLVVGIIIGGILIFAPIRTVRYDGLKYLKSNNGYTVTDCNKAKAEVIIPEKLRGVKVTSIGDGAFRHCTSLTNITIPNSVTSIDYSAFCSCTSLTSITIPNSVTSIGDGAFSDCTSLTSITIPNSVTSIDYSAFSSCTSLTSITIPDSVTSIENHAFFNCTSLTSITIPDSVTSIGTSAFNRCTSLTSITIPDSVTSIGDYAFEDCTSLASITIPDSVTSISRSAFSSCTSLTSITIPDSVTSIGEYAIFDCDSLESIIIPNSVTSIGYLAFGGCTSLTIYCETKEMPENWADNWNGNRPVVWGYTEN